MLVPIVSRLARSLTLSIDPSCVLPIVRSLSWPQHKCRALILPEARKARYPREGALSRLIGAWPRGSANRVSRVMPMSRVMAREI